MARIYCWVHTHRLTKPGLAWLVSAGVCDEVFLLVSNSRGVFYDSAIYPRRSTPLRLEAVAGRLRAAGIRVHAWILALKYSDEYFARRNLGLYYVSKTGASIVFHPPFRRGNMWLDPGNPRVRRLVAAASAEAADLGLFDAVHLDYIRYPDNPPAPGVARLYGVPAEYSEERDYGYGVTALREFNEEAGLDARALEYGSPGYEAWSGWRVRRVKEIVELVAKECGRRGVRVSAAVFPTPEHGYRSVLQK